MTSIKSNCSFCKRDIRLSFYIECAVCQDIQLCVDCFSAGVNIDNHVNSHAYKVSDCLEGNLFVKDWSIREELLLLEGIEKNGAGNWKTISDYINTNKGTKQVEDHYWELLMENHGYCLPATYSVQNITNETKTLFPQDLVTSENGKEIIPESDYYRIPLNAEYKRGEKVQRDIGKENNLKAKDKNEILQKNLTLPGADLPGFMPLREDFEVEYENDAEFMLADMEFGPDDHESETALKLQVIQIYNHKLAERDRRKRFVIDRGLVNIKEQQSKEKRLSKEERELVGKLRVFSRFQSKEEHEALVDGLLKAKRLRHQIELYKVYRQMGLRSLEEVRGYEADKKHREKDAKGRKMREAVSNAYDSKAFSDFAEEEDDFPSEKRRRGRPPKMDAEEQERRTRSRLSKNSSSEVTSSSSGNNETVSSEDIESLRKAPYGDKLADLELELCVRIPLFPQYYLAVKEALVREAYRNGSLTVEGVKRILKLDSEQNQKIFDFFVKEVRINEVAPGQQASNGFAKSKEGTS